MNKNKLTQVYNNFILLQKKRLWKIFFLIFISYILFLFFGIIIKSYLNSYYCYLYILSISLIYILLNFKIMRREKNKWLMLNLRCTNCSYKFQLSEINDILKYEICPKCKQYIFYEN